MSEEKQPSPSEAPEPVQAPFTLIGESKDGRLCLFEDAEGHLTLVRAEKLA